MKQLKCIITTFLKILTCSILITLFLCYSFNIPKIKQLYNNHSINKFQFKPITKIKQNVQLKNDNEINKRNLRMYKEYKEIDWFKKIEEININKSREYTQKSILIFDSFKWWNFDGKLTNCPVPELNNLCDFTEDHKEIKTTDAVIIIRDFFHKEEIKIPLKSNKLKIIYYTLETPQVTNFRVTEGTFLASFWRGSDFWTPYYKWDKASTTNSMDYENKSFRNYARGKMKSVAAVISNCITTNDRIAYIKELQKYIQVDVFGNCGDFECAEKEGNKDLCFQTISKDYKFYLAFENTNCRDYITEKLFHNALKFDMIPVVFGAHRKDYEAVAPPKNSYIHIEDFETPNDLSNYLKLIEKNDTLYNEYFKWKYYKDRIEEQQSHFFCQVCAMLLYSQYYEVKSRLKNNFIWNNQNEEICLPSGMFYWDR